MYLKIKLFFSLKLLVRNIALLFVPTFMFVLSSCNDMEDQLRQNELPVAEEFTTFFVLSEGLFNLNNSTLAMYNLNTKETFTDFFLSVNKRGLGDTANDMGLYGSKLYVVVTVSSQVEILDASTGKSLKRIPMFNGQGIAREPRFIDFHNGKAYVCSFDGTVAKIDTASMKIEGFVTCGRNPDGICITNDKIYVSNSGGLSYPNYDNTVSVIDIETFKEIKKIIVGSNPYKLHADSEGDVYVVSRGNYRMQSGLFQKINSKTDEVAQSFDDIQALNFTIHNDTAYIYNYHPTSNQYSFVVFDCKSEIILNDNFITDGTVLHNPFGIDVNPANSDVYITEAYAYTIWGDVLCFDNHGKLKFRLREIGLNPNKVVFK